LLAACGGDDQPEQVYTIVQRYPSGVQAPGEVRLPFSLSTGSATFVDDGPTELEAQIVDLDGNQLGDPISAVRRDTTPAAYYDFRTTIDEPGVYSIVVESGPPEGANFQVLDPSEITVPGPGDVLAGFATPTTTEPAGVDPICTREPMCEFHSLTLTEALDTGMAVAYLVGTPAFCQTGSCTPSLEALIEVSRDHSDRLTVVHAEVYTDLTATVVAPAVEALGLAFEPTLFLVGADGVVVERLDGLWNETELAERLALLTE
jgi:hypothetical protein